MQFVLILSLKIELLRLIEPCHPTATTAELQGFAVIFLADAEIVNPLAVAGSGPAASFAISCYFR
jgi:hypothetical protein